MLTIEQIHEFWRNPDEKNTPEKYAEDAPVMSAALHILLSRHVKPESLILEIGCNCGRNLHYIYNAGYQNLRGIDINGDALRLMKIQYPDLVNILTVESTIEAGIGNIPDGAFDCVYSVAVLEHIHPDSEWIFAEMTRITKNHIITIEDESSVSPRHFQRNYQSIFESLGMRQIDSMAKKPENHDGENLDRFAARVFEKVAS